jgi:hypothetical protein
MTNKPSLIGSLIVMAVALVLGLASGVLVSRATHTPGQDMADRIAEVDKTPAVSERRSPPLHRREDRDPLTE